MSSRWRVASGTEKRARQRAAWRAAWPAGGVAGCRRRGGGRGSGTGCAPPTAAAPGSRARCRGSRPRRARPGNRRCAGERAGRARRRDARSGSQEAGQVAGDRPRRSAGRRGVRRQASRGRLDAPPRPASAVQRRRQRAAEERQRAGALRRVERQPVARRERQQRRGRPRRGTRTSASCRASGAASPCSRPCAVDLAARAKSTAARVQAARATAPRAAGVRPARALAGQGGPRRRQQDRGRSVATQSSGSVARDQRQHRLLHPRGEAGGGAAGREHAVGAFGHRGRMRPLGPQHRRHMVGERLAMHAHRAARGAVQVRAVGQERWIGAQEVASRPRRRGSQRPGGIGACVMQASGRRGHRRPCCWSPASA